MKDGDKMQEEPVSEAEKRTERDDIPDKTRSNQTILNDGMIVQQLLNANPETALIVDRHGVVLAANDKAARTLGTTVAGLLGSVISDYYEKEEALVIKNLINKTLQVKGMVCHTKMHGDRYYEIFCYPLVGEGGLAAGVALVAVDITRRQEAERELQSERHKFRVLAENVPLGISLIGSNGWYQYVNPKFVEMFGYEHYEIADGKSWFRRAYPDPAYRFKVIGTWLEDFEHFKPGEKKTWIFTVTCKDGSQKIVHFMPVQLESGDVLVAYEDFSELIAARESLEESESKFRLLFEKSVDSTLLFNGEFISDCNEAAVRIFNCSAKCQVLGHHLVSFSAQRQPDGRLSMEAMQKIIEKTLHEGSSRFEWLYKTTTEEERWADVSFTVITIKGKPIIYVILRDITMRKRVEEKVEHLSSFPELNPNPIIEIDTSGNIMFCNAAAIETLNKLDVRDGGRAFLPADIDLILSGIDRTKTTKFYREVNIKGAVFDETIHFAHRFNSVRVYANDVTERRRAEEALRKSEERYRQMFDNIPLPALLYDLDTFAIVDVNRAAVQHYGYSPGEFQGMKILSMSPEEDVPLLRKRLVQSNPTDYSGPWRHVKKDGTVITVEVTGHPLLFTGKQYRIVIINDITERKRIEDALKFTQFAVDRAAVGIFWMGRDGRLKYVNDEACKRLGYTREELLNMTVHVIDPHYYLDTWQEHWDNVATLESVTFESLHRTKEGNTFPVEITENYMEYEKTEYLCSVVRDITERKRSEEDILKRERELEAKSTSLQDANTALKVLLKHREEDRSDLEEKVVMNMKELVLPYLDKLKKTRLDPSQSAYLDIVETNLKDITSPFTQKMVSKFINFTPTEIQVANMIRAGKTSKEIAEVLKVSPGTIDTHRNNIRSKLGLNNKKQNLRAFLLTLSKDYID